MKDQQNVALAVAVPSRDSETGLLHTLCCEALERWQESDALSAAEVLDYLGLLYRMTNDLANESERVVWQLSKADRRRLVLQALISLSVEQVTKHALYYLNIDDRRNATQSRWAWAGGFSSLVLSPRDHLQLVIDSAARIAEDLIAERDPLVCRSLVNVVRKLVILDNVLAQSTEAVQSTVRFFRGDRFVAEHFDLSRYWWFGPNRRVDARRILLPLWADYGLPETYFDDSGAED